MLSEVPTGAQTCSPDCATCDRLRGSAAVRDLRQRRLQRRSSMARWMPALTRLKDIEQRKMAAPGRAETQGFT